MTGVSIDSLTAGNLPKLVPDQHEGCICEGHLHCTHQYTTSAHIGNWGCCAGASCKCPATQLPAHHSVRYLVPILGGGAPICSTCEGSGSIKNEKGTKYYAPLLRWHTMPCPDCKDGVPTSITLTVECETCSCGASRYRLRHAPSCLFGQQRPVARASLLQVIPIEDIESLDCSGPSGWQGPYVARTSFSLDLFLAPVAQQSAVDISALLPLASWETSKWALLVKDVQPTA